MNNLYEASRLSNTSLEDTWKWLFLVQNHQYSHCFCSFFPIFNCYWIMISSPLVVTMKYTKFYTTCRLFMYNIPERCCSWSSWSSSTITTTTTPTTVIDCEGICKTTNLNRWLTTYLTNQHMDSHMSHRNLSCLSTYYQYLEV